MSRCYEIFKQSSDNDTRGAAVELLRVVADRRAVPWIAEFLDDSDAGVQLWGVGVLDQLLWSKLVDPKEVEDPLQRADRHENTAVREHAEFIRSFLRDRTETARCDDAK